MNNPVPPEEDRRLSELFQTLTPPLEDKGFSESVLQRISRRQWLRRVVLSTAAVFGGIVALGPLSELSVLLAEVLIAVATQWNDPAWLAHNWMILIMAVLAATVPVAIRLLER